MPRAMILAAGSGTRLYPLTFGVAKPMVPVLNRPVMEHIVLLLRRHGINRLIANLCHGGEGIAAYFADGAACGVELAYSRETELLGTAGGVRNARSFFGGEPFFVVGGDDLANFDLTAMIEFHRRRRALATIAVMPVKEVSQYGVVVADDRGRIQSFQEKPAPKDALSNLANTMVYLFEQDIFDFIPPTGFYDFGKQAFPLLLERGAPFYAWQAQGYWKDIGSPREYLQANLDALSGKVGLELPGAEVGRGVWSEGRASLAEAAVAPPVLLGERARLAAGSSVKRTIIGTRAQAPAGAELENCVVWDGVKVPAISARRAILTRDCVVWV